MLMMQRNQKVDGEIAQNNRKILHYLARVDNGGPALFRQRVSVRTQNSRRAWRISWFYLGLGLWRLLPALCILAFWSVWDRTAMVENGTLFNGHEWESLSFCKGFPAPTDGCRNSDLDEV